MAERDVAAEILKGLQEVREHRAGARALRETRIEATPLPELHSEMIERIRENLEGPRGRRIAGASSAETIRDGGRPRMRLRGRRKVW